jgi:hypothetical protein
VKTVKEPIKTSANKHQNREQSNWAKSIEG